MRGRFSPRRSNFLPNSRRGLGCATGSIISRRAPRLRRARDEKNKTVGRLGLAASCPVRGATTEKPAGSESMAPSPPYRGAVDITPLDTENISDTEAWLFTTMEEYWIKPCHARLGDALIGMCMFGPAFVVAACILLPTLFLAMRQQRAADMAAQQQKKK